MHLSVSTIQTLANNKDNSEPEKMATQLAYSLKQKGWDIRTAWTPSHIGIKSNEKADEMAKLGAKGELGLCQHACVTKAWWYTKARKRYLGKRRMELGIKHLNMLQNILHRPKSIRIGMLNSGKGSFGATNVQFIIVQIVNKFGSLEHSQKNAYCKRHSAN
jgi:hypothetical protein